MLGCDRDSSISWCLVISLLADGRFDTSLFHPATGNYKLSFNNNAIVLVQERTEPSFQNENNTWSIILSQAYKWKGQSTVCTTHILFKKLFHLERTNDNTC